MHNVKIHSTQHDFHKAQKVIEMEYLNKISTVIFYI